MKNTPQQNEIKQNGAALISGMLFGLGLGLSQMIDRGRVLAFLDIAGAWDATLLFVLGGAVTVTLITFRLVLNRPTPIFSHKFYLPTRTRADRPLIIGAAIFGIGWGITGYCPGPAITALVLGQWNPVVFLLALVAGSAAHQWLSNRTQPSKLSQS